MTVFHKTNLRRMDDLEFPIYRKSLSGKNWYRINSIDRLVEVQQMGEKYYKHELTATIYPDKLLIQDLIACQNYEVCSEEEFEKHFCLT